LATPSAAEQLGLPEEITPEAMRGLLMQGYHHLSANALSLAALHAQAALDYDSQHPDAHHLLAQVALRENRPGDALRSVLKSIQVFPEHALYHLTVSEIYGVQQRFNEQAFALQEASRLDPANMGIKTRLLMAKRKAMLQAAERAQQAPQASGEHRAYELIVSENHVRAVKNKAVPADR
jgi:tetratricopeptide (TPR) repeat protein